MKKIIILSACIAIGSIQVSEAQHKNTIAPPPPPPPMAYVATPPPPPPPPPIAPIPPKEIVTTKDVSDLSFVEIVNSNGYDISVRKIKGIKTVFVQKDGKTQRIKLSTWNANKKFYEKKYGQLPPPPPPVPVKEETMFTPPVIEKNN